MDIDTRDQNLFQVINLPKIPNPPPLPDFTIAHPKKDIPQQSRYHKVVLPPEDHPHENHDKCAPDKNSFMDKSKFKSIGSLLNAKYGGGEIPHGFWDKTKNIISSTAGAVSEGAKNIFTKTKDMLLPS